MIISGLKDSIGLYTKPSEIQKITKEREMSQNDFDSFMDCNDIAMWLSPSSTGPAPRGLSHTGDPCMNLPWSFLGVPALNIPVHVFSNGLPGGIQCTSRYGWDEELIFWGSEIKKLFSAT